MKKIVWVYGEKGKATFQRGTLDGEMNRDEIGLWHIVISCRSTTSCGCCQHIQDQPTVIVNIKGYKDREKAMADAEQVLENIYQSF